MKLSYLLLALLVFSCSKREALRKVRSHALTNEVMPLPEHPTSHIARKADGSIWVYEDSGFTEYTDGGTLLFPPQGASPYIEPEVEVKP